MSYRKAIDDVWSKINSIQEELEDLDEGENARVESLLHEYYIIDSRLIGLMNSLQSSTRSTPINLSTGESSITSNPIAVQLPDLQLSAIDDYLKKWSTFYDTFSSTIDKNSTLTDIQKFHYLRSALRGEAANCLNALSHNNANYNEAITLLKESVECPRETAVSHCMAIINHPKITKESPTELMHLVHSCKQHIYALNKLGDYYSDTSAMIYSLMLSKVPASIQRQWKMTLPNKELPQYTQFLNFLERLAQSCRSTTTVTQTRGSSDQSNLVSQRAPRGHAFTAK
jgi:hypothetical protein